MSKTTKSTKSAKPTKGVPKAKPRMTGKVMSPTVVADAYPQLGFTFGNKDAANTVYASADVLDNNIGFAIGTNAATSFTEATPVPRDQASGASGSLVYLDLSPLHLTQLEFAALVVTLEGWTCAKYDDSVLCFAPDGPVSLAPAEVLTAVVAGFTLSKPPTDSMVSVDVTYYRVGTITTGNIGSPGTITVAIQAPPRGEHDLKQYLDLDLSPIGIVTSMSEDELTPNSIKLVFQKGRDTREVLAGPDTRFSIAFTYADQGPGYGALMTPRAAASLRFKREAAAELWTIDPHVDRDTPVWELRPPDDSVIVGGSALPSFGIDNIATTFRPGPTEVIVTYENVPGYRNGTFALRLDKMPHVDIESLTVEPPVSTLVKGKAAVVVKWTVADAQTLMLSRNDGSKTETVSGKTSFSTTVERTTMFSLLAFGQTGTAAPNVAIASTEAVVRPQVGAFTIAPTAVAVRHLPATVELSWNVNTNDKVRILSSLTGLDPTEYDPDGGTTKTVTAPQIFTLFPQGSTDPTLRRSRQIGAFVPEARIHSTADAVGAVALPRNEFYVAVAKPAKSSVSILSSVSYTSIAELGVGAAPAAIAFTPKGDLIVVANAGDGTVSQYLVRNEPGGAVTFEKAATLTVQAGLVTLAVSPDGLTAFAVVDTGASTAGVIKILTRAEGGAFTVSSESVEIGVGPKDIAVASTGAVYVTCQADSAVHMLAKGDVWQRVGVIENVDGGPTGCAVTPDGNLLLVSCVTANVVTAINPAYADVAARARFRVGRAPHQIAVIPNGPYAFVANRDDGTVSMIRYNRSGGSVYDSTPVTVAKGPVTMAASSNGGFLVVGSQGQNELTTVALAQFGQRTLSPQPGGAVSSVAASPDSTAVATWFDVNRDARRLPHKPILGVVRYDTATWARTPALTTMKVVDAAYLASAAVVSGKAGAKKKRAALAPATTPGFVAAAAQSLQVCDDKLAPIGDPIPLPGTGRAVRSLAASADGSTVFVLSKDGEGVHQLVVYAAAADRRSLTLVSDVLVFTSKPATFTALAAAPDGAKAYVVESIADTMFTVARGKDGTYAVDPTTLGLSPNVNAAAVSPDGNQLYLVGKATSGRTTFSAYDTVNRKVRVETPPEFTDDVNIDSLAVSADGSQVFASDGTVARVHILDAVTLQFVQTITWEGSQGSAGICALANGNQVVSANIRSANLAIAQRQQPLTGNATDAVLTEAGEATYDGLFIRHRMGDEPYKTGGTTTCPDIIMLRELPPDAKVFGQTGSAWGQYGWQPSNRIEVGPGARNFVYLRGLNMGTAPDPNVRLWFYWIPENLFLNPRRWRYDGVWYGGQLRNWVDLPVGAAGTITVTDPNLYVEPDAPGHICVVAFAENEPLIPQEQPCYRIPNFATFSDLAAWVVQTPYMGWLNTVSLPTDPTGFSAVIPCDAPEGGGQFRVGWECNNMPVDGVDGKRSLVSIFCQGPASGGDVVKIDVPIKDKDERITFPTKWDPGYKSQVTLTYKGQMLSTGWISPIVTYELRSLIDEHPHLARLAERASVPVLQGTLTGGNDRRNWLGRREVVCGAVNFAMSGDKA